MKAAVDRIEEEELYQRQKAEHFNSSDSISEMSSVLSVEIVDPDNEQYTNSKKMSLQTACKLLKRPLPGNEESSLQGQNVKEEEIVVVDEQKTQVSKKKKGKKRYRHIKKKVLKRKEYVDHIDLSSLENISEDEPHIKDEHQQVNHDEELKARTRRFQQRITSKIAQKQQSKIDKFKDFWGKSGLEISDSEMADKNKNFDESCETAREEDENNDLMDLIVQPIHRQERMMSIANPNLIGAKVKQKSFGAENQIQSDSLVYQRPKIPASDQFKIPQRKSKYDDIVSQSSKKIPEW